MDKNEKMEQERLSDYQRHRERIVDEVLSETGDPLTILKDHQCSMVFRKIFSRKGGIFVNVKV